jgi:oxidase EvaA
MTVAGALNAHSAVEALRWLREGQSARLLQVERIPLDAMRDWSFDFRTGNLGHRSGRFFSIGGISVVTSYGSATEWMQPIIDQPEIGILGLLAAHSRGRLRFLVQRKVEPGNANVSQVSPTVQATHSNYTRVHGGSAPPYLEYFLNPPRGSIQVDQLQTEQAARYAGKRNRNMIVLVNADEVSVDTDDYRWTTLEELQRLALEPNALNLDTRSVMSCLPLSFRTTVPHDESDDRFSSRLLASLKAGFDEARLSSIDGWLGQVQRSFGMTVRRVPLRSVAGWTYDGSSIAHESGKFFEVAGVSVHAPSREVPRWDQPLIWARSRGVVGLLCQRRQGVLQFLVRGVLEPGEPAVRVGPTVQCIPENHRVLPPFFSEIVHAPDRLIRFRTIQSEEGGRFHHDERMLIVVEMPEDAPLDHPLEFTWMTLRDIKETIARCANVNIELRSLIACLPVAD